MANTSFIPDHMTSQKSMFQVWTTMSVLLFMAIFGAGFVVSPIIYAEFGKPLNAASWGEFSIYMGKALTSIDYVTGAHSQVWSSNMLAGLACLIVPLLFALLVSGIFFASCPYRNIDMIYGDVRWAGEADFRAMEKRKQVGIRGATLGILGKTEQGEPVRLIETISATCVAPPGSGKCLHPDEPVLMYDGTIKRTGDLEVGDLLMGPDSKPRTVLVTNPGHGPMYSVALPTGKTFRCNGDHILSLYNKNSGQIEFVTVDQFNQTPHSERCQWSAWRSSLDFNQIGDDRGIEKLTANLVRDKRPYTAGALLASDNHRATTNHTDPLFQTEIDRHQWLSGYIAHCRHEYTSPGNEKFEMLLELAHPSHSDLITTIARSLDYAVAPGSPLTERPGLNKKESDSPPTLKLNYRMRDNFPAPPPAVHVDHGSIVVTPIGDGPYFGIIIDGDHQYLLDDFTVTHNTAAVIVPAIVNSSNASIIANDPKPEIAQMTSGFRSEIGFVYILDWSMTDKPSEGIYHPRFNFLDKRLVPPAGTAERDTYIDAMARTLVPDTKGGGDKYFTDQGRECLVGYMHWLVSHVNDHASYDGIPAKWHGKEASFPMMIDWLAEARYKAAERAKKLDKESDNKFQQTDPEQLFLTEICDVARERGYSPRAFTSLSKLIPMADKERSGVNGTMNQALLPFANAAVMERTSACDFLPKDLRGMYEPILKPLAAIAAHYKVNQAALREAMIASDLLTGDGHKPTSLALTRGFAYRTLDKDNAAGWDWDSQKLGELLNDKRMTKIAPEKGEELPVTLYICVNQAEAEAFRNITALLYEVLSREYIAYGPGEVNKRGEKMGGKPILFIMDEFAKLPKCEQVLKGPDLGRSKKVSYWFAYQAKSQMEEVYSKEQAESLNSTIGTHIILPQNDPTTIKHYVDMVGKTTIFKTSNSKQVGMSKSVNPFTKNESISVEGIDFLTPGDISGMKPGTQLVLAQNFFNRPMKLKSPFFFEDPEMLSKVYNMRNGQGPQPAPPLPEHVRQMRIAEHKAQLALTQAVEAEKQAEGLAALALRKAG